MNVVDKAINVALRYHFGHSNKHNGEPYVLHLHRVAMSTRDKGYGEAEQATAWLHDVLEDTDCTIHDLYDAGIPSEVVVAVEMLTKTKNGENQKYYERVRENPIARVVKLQDLTDNFRRNHLIEEESTRLRMARKYSMGFDILGG